MIGRYLNLGSPVETAHPLNLGLVSWWLPLPNNSGGFTLFDLMRRNNGTLTNGPAWAAGAHPFAHALSFDGSDDHVSFPAYVFGDDGTIVITFRPRSDFASGDHPLFSLRSNALGLTLLLDFYASGGTLYCGWYHSAGAGDRRATWAISGITTGQWHQLAMTWKVGVSTTIHANGDLKTTAADPGASMWDTSLGTPYLATTQLHGTAYAADDIAEMRWYNRQVPADTLAALREDYLLGYPRTLRRWSRRRWLDVPAAAGGAFKAAWARGSNVLISPGVV
jgi:uncharacterized protein YodC (DUF2158 family)